MSIIRIVNKFRQILSRHQKIRILELAVLMVIGGFLEMLSVSLMLPFMTTVMEPDSVMGNRYVRMVCELLDLQITSTFLVAFSAALALVNLESLACGTPVVTYRTGGSPECVDETCGIVVEKDDVDALEAAILRCQAERPFSETACIARAGRFDKNQKFKEYVKLYEARGGDSSLP